MMAKNKTMRQAEKNVGPFLQSVFLQLSVTCCCVTNDPTAKQVRKMAQWVKEYASKTDELNLIHGTYLLERENRLHQFSLLPTHIYLYPYTHTYKHTHMCMHTQRSFKIIKTKHIYLFS